MLEAIEAGTEVNKIYISDSARDADPLRSIAELAAARSIPIMRTDKRRLGTLAGTERHQGVVAIVSGFRYAELNELLESETRRLVLLDGVTDPANLGSILRSAEAFGFTGVLVPRHRSAAVTPVVRKIAAGAAERVSVAQVGSPSDTILRMQQAGVWVLGLDPEGQIDHTATRIADGPVCLVVGAEGRGLSRLVRQRCDELIRIPMKGSLASINVAVAAAIVMVEVTRNRG